MANSKERPRISSTSARPRTRHSGMSATRSTAWPSIVARVNLPSLPQTWSYSLRSETMSVVIRKRSKRVRASSGVRRPPPPCRRPTTPVAQTPSAIEAASADSSERADHVRRGAQDADERGRRGLRRRAIALVGEAGDHEDPPGRHAGGIADHLLRRRSQPLRRRVQHAPGERLQGERDEGEAPGPHRALRAADDAGSGSRRSLSPRRRRRSSTVSRCTALEWSCETRDSVTPSTVPTSRIVSSSW